MFTNRLNYEPELKRQEWKDTDSPVKKKFRAQLSVKTIIMTIFWDMKELITIALLEKCRTKSASCCPYLQNDPRMYNISIHLPISK